MEPYQELEQRWGEWAGVGNCVACSSGSAALHLALESFGLPLGSRVIVPEFTMIACARAVVLAGLQPVFVDCGDDLTIDAEKVDEILKANSSLRSMFPLDEISAIMPVHVYGRACDMKAINFLVNQYDLAVVEDCAEFHGGRTNWLGLDPSVAEMAAKVGFAPSRDSSCWSFYRNKIVAGEEGGMVSFADPEAAQRARQLRSLGFTDAHDFLHVPRGHNYRMSNAHAKLVLESLGWSKNGYKADENLARRRYVEGWYDDAIPDEWRMPKRYVVWVYDLRIPGLGYERMDRVVRRLNAQGIAARHGFKPMSMQPEFQECSETSLKYICPNAYQASQEVFYLPVSPSMDADEAQWIAARTIEAVQDTGVGW